MKPVLIIGGGIGLAGLAYLLFRNKAEISDAASYAMDETTAYIADTAASVAEGATTVAEGATAVAGRATEIVEDVMLAVTDTMPKAAIEYWPIVQQMASRYGVDPWILLGIGWHESRWGTASGLVPKGAGGTGDWVIRQPEFDSVVNAVLNGNEIRKIWSKSELPTDIHKWTVAKNKKTGADYAFPWAIPADGLGWGRGLMQLDYQNIDPNTDWSDPAVAIEHAASMLAQYRRQIDAKVSGIDPGEITRAAVAAYNMGVAKAVSALQSGSDVDALTTGRNYSSDVLAQAEKFSGSAQG